MEGEPLDPGRLLPVIVPAGYFPSRVPACTPFPAGVDVAFGETEICAVIPHRDIMFLFGARDQAWRSRMQALITEKESDGRKPITRRLIRLPDVGTVPYYERPSFEYLD